MKRWSRSSPRRPYNVLLAADREAMLSHGYLWAVVHNEGQHVGRVHSRHRAEKGAKAELRRMNHPELIVVRVKGSNHDNERAA